MCTVHLVVVIEGALTTEHVPLAELSVGSSSWLDDVDAERERESARAARERIDSGVRALQMFQLETNTLSACC